MNCQWPEYWQLLFNARGYVCDDAFRWEIRNIQEIEPWYRQNIFIAKLSPKLAGHEPRIRAVVNPDMFRQKFFDVFAQEQIDCIAQIVRSAAFFVVCFAFGKGLPREAKEKA